MPGGVDPRELAAALYVNADRAKRRRNPQAQRRREVREEIAVLERALNALHEGMALPARAASKGPRLPSLAELEAERAELLRRLTAAQARLERGRREVRDRRRGRPGDGAGRAQAEAHDAPPPGNGLNLKRVRPRLPKEGQTLFRFQCPVTRASFASPRSRSTRSTGGLPRGCVVMPWMCFVFSSIQRACPSHNVRNDRT